MIQPPTSRLPPVANIASFTTTQLTGSIQYLQSLYRPQVRGSRRRHREVPNDATHNEEEVVRSDAFERAYAIRWLTALIAQLESRTSSDCLVDDTDALVQQAASLLATCAGVAAAGMVQRRFTFESALAGTIHVDLADIPLDNHDYASVGAQTWGGAYVLAEMIAEHPQRFGLLDTPRDGTRSLRILELGSGTGLVGLTIAKLLQVAPSSQKDPPSNPNPPLHPRATIVLTDFYPPVLVNLESNVVANFSSVPDNSDHAIRITSHPLDWSSFCTTPIPDVLSTPFDIIFGADIVYEAQHAVWIRNCLLSLLARPDESNEEPTFHLVIPLRSTHTFESSTIEEVFGSKSRSLEGSQRELTIFSTVSIVCEAYGDGRAERSRSDDDVEYLYYRIGWAR